MVQEIQFLLQADGGPGGLGYPWGPGDLGTLEAPGNLETLEAPVGKDIQGVIGAWCPGGHGGLRGPGPVGSGSLAGPRGPSGPQVAQVIR